MAKQEKVVREPRKESGGKPTAANPKIIEKGKEIKKSIDDVLDNIDDILEKNAEEFVKQYVQKGGQ